jgi:hypothetical protein
MNETILLFSDFQGWIFKDGKFTSARKEFGHSQRSSGISDSRW